MKIAVASGKGGTGKTTVATCLAWTARQQGRDVLYLDCDVEEPNAHLFLKPDITETRKLTIPFPDVDESRCTACGECDRICQFSAIIVMGGKCMTFPDMCHACGGCMLACPEKCITEKQREVGVLETGVALGGAAFVHGLLRVGEALSVPLIREVKKAAWAQAHDLVIMDSPPGTSCPVIATVRDCDYVLLVTEPTPFGLHDLGLAADMVRALKLPTGVVINRAGGDDGLALRFCREHDLPVIAEIPEDRKVAQAYSRGLLPVEAVPETQQVFQVILAAVESAAKEAAL
jgi:MinD superfamily P-loop ATPase